MKRIAASLLLAAALLFTSAVSASTIDLTAMTDGELHALSNEILAELESRQISTVSVVGSYTVEIKGGELMKDDEGGDCLVVTVEWSHHMDEPQTFFWSFDYVAYQDGIEIFEPDAYINLPINTQDTRIKAGAILETQIAYALHNTSSPVELEISEFLGDTNEKVEKTFDLSALGGGTASGQPVSQTTGSGLSAIGKPAP